MKVKQMTRFISSYVGNQTTERKNFLWNMIGSGIFAAMSMFLSFFMIRVLGTEEGGIFAIAITISQMLAFIEYYETRTFQVTDVTDSYSFGNYKFVKLILLVVAIVIAFIYSLIKGSGLSEKCQVIFLMCIYRYIDAYSDLYEGTFQKDGRLDLTGKSQAFRTVLSAGMMCITVLITHNLRLSIIVGVFGAVVGLWIFDAEVMKIFRSLKIDFSISQAKKILLECFPLFCGSFLWTYILSASRIAVDAHLQSSFSSDFQILFMPISVINLCATFILKPALPELAELFSKKNTLNFVSKVGKISLAIIIFTVICMVGAYLIGIPILSFLIGYDLSSYKNLLVLLMLAGGVNSLSYFGYYLLTVMRRNTWIFAGYISSAGVSYLVSNLLVKNSGLIGAGWSFFISVTELFLVFLVGTVIGISRNK